MTEKMYLITKTQIVKASNMTNARSIIDGKNDILGDMLSDTTNVKEVSEREASKYFSVVDEEDFIYSDYSEAIGEEDDEDIAPANPMLDSIGVHASTVDFLRSENKRLARMVDKYKNVRQEASQVVYQAAYDSFSAFSLPSVPKPNLGKSLGIPETAVAVLSDWQLGKVTPDYNSEVLEKRMEIYADKILEITEIQRAHHPVDNLHVWILGDIVEGEEIFPGQSHLIDSGIYRQVGVNGPRILGAFFQKMLANFKHIHVTAVIGNHGAVGGRARKQHDPETNMDRLLYKICELVFESEDRISFHIPDGKGERNWYAVDYIGDYGTLLIHGDQMAHPSSVNSYYKKIMGWKDGAIPEKFDDVFMGHYHQQFKMTIGSTILRVSGSPESYNTYAQEYFHSMSRPCQHLMFVHPDKGVTSEYSIWLDEA
jgi:hypothetical protein